MSFTDSRLGEANVTHPKSYLDSYRRLADVFHSMLSEQSLDALLDHIADALSEIVPYDSLTIYYADEIQRLLIPVLARDRHSEQIMNSTCRFGEGITGWAVQNKQPVLANDACSDPRVTIVPGTPDEPEALVCVPLVARGSVQGALNIYRQGDEAAFGEEDFELAVRFADAAALAVDNARARTALEHQAQTDALTGLFNHRYFHERLTAELSRATRVHDKIGLVLLDIDDFKAVNNAHGHAVGDLVLTGLSEILSSLVRGSDVVCRLGGEEFAVIMPSCDAGDALGLAMRIAERAALAEFGPAEIAVSLGVAQGPDHAPTARELLGCAEAAILSAKSKGGARIVLYDEDDVEGATRRPRGPDVRSIAHLKMLKSLTQKLNRINDVRQMAEVIVHELRALIDYSSCCVYSVESQGVVPLASRGDVLSPTLAARVASTGKTKLKKGPTESRAAVALRYGSRINGVLVVSKLGNDTLDEDEVRLLEVLAGQATVAFENARLYEAQRREAEKATALLQFADSLYGQTTIERVAQRTVESAAALLDAPQSSLWLLNEATGQYECQAHCGYATDPEALPVLRRAMDADKAEAMLADHRDPFIVTPEDPHGYEWPADATARAFCVAPLRPDEGIKGWIRIRHPFPEGSDHFTDDRMRLLAGISYHASAAMEKARLYKDQKENAEIANALLDFGRELSIADGLDDVLGRIVELTARLVGSPRVSVWLQTEPQGDVLPRALWGYEGADWVRATHARFRDEVARPYLERTEPFVMHADEAAQVDGSTGSQLSSAIAPLQMDGRLGCIVVSAPVIGRYDFSDRKMRLLAGIAHQSKLALSTAVTFETMEETFVSTVEALANALEAKDQYTSSHARSITDMALRVGEELGMESSALKRLELGALFHDIGKIGIPHAILTKPGPLTDEEWAIIKTHPELGERILAPIDRLAEVRPIVRHCHEHFDGSGYPDAWSGDNIPVESRIILVCDAFHAMTTDRPYRGRLPLAEATRRLVEAAGGQFDPDIVDTFLSLLRDYPEFAA